MRNYRLMVSTAVATNGAVVVGSSIAAPHQDMDNFKFAKSNGESKPIRPEAKYTGSGKHGVKWKEDSTTAKSLNTPQWQWSQKDLEFASQRAASLKPGESAYFDLPPGSTSVVYA